MMASWSEPPGLEPDRNAGLYWQDMDGDTPNDGNNDFLGQFVDFDVMPTASAPPQASEHQHLFGQHHAGPGAAHDLAMFHMPPSFLLDPHADSTTTTSSGVSTADEFDFLSSNSQAPKTSSFFGGDIDPSALGLAAESSRLDCVPRASMSDTDLPRLEGISLASPRNMPASHPSSPTPPGAALAPQGRKSNKFVEALSTTIRKATTRRKARKPANDCPASPTAEKPRRPLKQTKSRTSLAAQRKVTAPAATRSSAHDGTATRGFVHGAVDDPFTDEQPPPLPSAAANLRCLSQDCASLPRTCPPALDDSATTYQIGPPAAAGTSMPVSWDQHHRHHQLQQQQQQLSQASTPAHWPGSDYLPVQSGGWWDLAVWQQQQQQQQSCVHDLVDHQHNANLNYVVHTQQSELPYEYSSQLPDTSTAGLMIHMPQPGHHQATVITTSQPYLPPPPPPPPPAPASERPHRPPRAPSSGARHLSVSPMRRQRAPSASPTPHARSRHSSGGSISSVRSASGSGGGNSASTRRPGSMPGTPCSVRKRRSREPSGSGPSGSTGGGHGAAATGSGGDVGFVNFTPSDGSVLMTGVAPSGSSKTKARREKEANERRRRMSEAAMKAVAAAGGDVNKLIQQGFAF